MALVEGHINVHEALIYQTDTKLGQHTAKSGLFLRDAPGRLVLYPLLAATCAVVFFSGTWVDAGVAAVCGLASGVLEYFLSALPSSTNVNKVLIDVIVGTSTGVIGGLWYEHVQKCCLPSIFLGTLYWFFYGTAFVIGLLEIIAGELETGVTRFIAVSVKTFVLSLGAGIGLMISASGGARKIWFESDDQCDGEFIKEAWWRIPMYLLCSIAVLGQYRMPLNRYWLGLAVQLVAYEVQYKVYNAINEEYTADNLDTVASNIAGATGGVACACALSWIVNTCRTFYIEQIMRADDTSSSAFARFIYGSMNCFVKFYSCLRIGRESDILKLNMANKLRDQSVELRDSSHPRDRIELQEEEEKLFLETIVSHQSVNIWSILMPAVYQLVPGSVIARFWFHSIFPPPADSLHSQESTFSNLMVISTSLALGLIIGFAFVQTFVFFVRCLAKCFCKKRDDERAAAAARRRHMRFSQGTAEMMYTAKNDADDDADQMLMNPPGENADYVDEEEVVNDDVVS